MRLTFKSFSIGNVILQIGFQNLLAFIWKIKDILKDYVQIGFQHI